MHETHILWEKIKNNKYNIFLSAVTLRELDACKEEKKNKLYGYLREINYTLVDINDKIINIAERIIRFDILQQKSFDDCQHIAAAITSGCDIIISWNFKHIVNIDTVKGVKAITAMEGYKDILIYAPSILVEGEENDS
jgi:predicted nucleic acid-binding protein